MPKIIDHTVWARSFRYRDFRFLFAASAAYTVAMGMDMVALGWLILDMTNSSFMVALAFAARMSPRLFLGILGGAIADQVNRRIYLRVITFGSGLTAALMAILILTNVASTWHVLVLAIAWGSLHSFIEPLRQAYIYDIVGREDALNGLALVSLGKRIGFIIGPFIAGAIISGFGVGEQYVAISVSCLISHITLYAVRGVGQSAPQRKKPTLHNLLSPLRLIQTNSILAILMFFTAVNELGFSFNIFLPVLARDVLGVGAQGLGVMNGVSAAGGTLAVFLLPSMGTFNQKGILMLTCVTLGGLSLIGLSQATNMFAIVALLATVNCCLTASETLNLTLMQTNVANEERGRAMGAFTSSVGAAQAGYMGIGAMAGLFGPPMALLTVGSILSFIAMASATGSVRMRRLT